MNLIDVHCHLGDKLFEHDLSQVLERASEIGVTAIVSSATSLPEIEKSLNISQHHPSFVFTSVGSDPTKLEAEWVEPILRVIQTNKSRIIGIGEVGLDYYWIREPEKRRRQGLLLDEWITTASELDLPLTVHSRSAGSETLEALQAKGFSRVLMHAYDGKVGHAMAAARAGTFFSIPVSVVYSEQKQKLVRRLSIDNLMLETDAPALPPVRGERNEPSNLVQSARKIAELKRIDVETVAQITTENASEFFSLPSTTQVSP